jgi:hypothetical protein
VTGSVLLPALPEVHEKKSCSTPFEIDRARIGMRPEASIPTNRRTESATPGATGAAKNWSQRYDAGLHLAAILHQADAQR